MIRCSANPSPSIGLPRYTTWTPSLGAAPTSPLPACQQWLGLMGFWSLQLACPLPRPPLLERGLLAGLQSSVLYFQLLEREYNHFGYLCIHSTNTTENLLCFELPPKCWKSAVNRERLSLLLYSVDRQTPKQQIKHIVGKLVIRTVEGKKQGREGGVQK